MSYYYFSIALIANHAWPSSILLKQQHSISLHPFTTSLCSVGFGICPLTSINSLSTSLVVFNEHTLQHMNLVLLLRLSVWCLLVPVFNIF